MIMKWGGVHRCMSQQRYNLIGPPDRQSNIRPIKLRSPSSSAEVKVQQLQQEVWRYNDEFWRTHNHEFVQAKSEFAKSHNPDVSKLSANELSVFYKDFLDTKYNQHVSYTKRWIRLQCSLTWNMLKLNLSWLFPDGLFNKKQH